MKRNLLLALSFLFCIGLQAQLTIVGSCPENVWADQTSTATITGSNKIKNGGGTALGKLSWKVTGYTVPTAWMTNFAFCDPEFCRATGQLSASTSFNFDDGKEGDFKPQFNPGSPGSGTITVCGWIDSDSAGTVQCCDYAMTFTGVEEINIDNKVKIFPNPAKNVLVAEVNNFTIEKVELFDIVGQKVKTVDFDNAIDYKIDISDLSEGMFIIKLHTEQGPVATKTFKRIN